MSTWKAMTVADVEVNSPSDVAGPVASLLIDGDMYIPLNGSGNHGDRQGRGDWRTSTHFTRARLTNDNMVRSLRRRAMPAGNVRGVTTDGNGHA